MPAKTWSAIDAQIFLRDVIDAAAGGEPQIIASETGHEVVLISRQDLSRHGLTLKTTLVFDQPSDRK